MDNANLARRLTDVLKEEVPGALDGTDPMALAVTAETAADFLGGLLSLIRHGTDPQTMQEVESVLLSRACLLGRQLHAEHVAAVAARPQGTETVQ